jgi:hypothetical protein
VTLTLCKFSTAGKYPANGIWTNTNIGVGEAIQRASVLAHLIINKE